MPRKKLDPRLKTLIENGVNLGHRTMFVIVGDKARDQVVILHHMLSKASVKARPTVLWCFKKELGFSSHRKKRMKQLQKKIKQGKFDIKEDDPFEVFVASTQIRYCYYKETHKILGNTFGMCVLQDFEALTPNLLARTIETVEGGGIILLMLKSVDSLKQLYTMTMDIHARYRTEAHQNVVGRFNERFILSLSSNKKCIVIDDMLNILPISSHVKNIAQVPPKTSEDALSPEDAELKSLKESLQDTQPVGVLSNLCKTLDQAKALLKFVDAIAEKTLRNTVSLTAARGRGKSAALGLAIAAAVGFGYSNIFVTSPSPENLNTLFDFVFKGFDALEYQEHIDYELIQSTNPDFNKAIVRVNIFHEHRQTIQYIHPQDAQKLGQAELVVIDEAAAIPLPLVKQLLGPYLVFMASTINGYEGTGRSLSLKLLEQLRQQSTPLSSKNPTEKGENMGRKLVEVTLDESIRYKPNDDVEAWLNRMLCLDATLVQPISSGCPPPGDCELYYINRDTLFSHHNSSEQFLHRVMSLFVASHYKNTPNDLQMMSDAPAHHLFCLLPPITNPDAKSLPEVLCVVQVCLEGEISKDSIMTGLSRGKRASGDLIPWTMAQQFQDDNFPSLSGARVVRIATHPDYQRFGYGSKALELLCKYYEFQFPNLDEHPEAKEQAIEPVDSEDVDLLTESISPRRNLPPLLLKLSERKPERLDYLGVSFGLTGPLLRFWKRGGYTPTYLRQTANDLTGEHTMIMLKLLNPDDKDERSISWLPAFWSDFRRRYIHMLGFSCFRSFPPDLALSILSNKMDDRVTERKRLTTEQLAYVLQPHDLLRLEKYCNNMADHHLITDLVPVIARLFFEHQLNLPTKDNDDPFMKLKAIPQAILVGRGLQNKTFEELEESLGLPTNQLLGLFIQMMKRFEKTLRQVREDSIASKLFNGKAVKTNGFDPLKQSMDDELKEAAEELRKKQKEQLDVLKTQDFSQYAVKGSEAEWDKALASGSKKLISVKVGEKRNVADPEEAAENPKKKAKKQKKKRAV